MAAGKVAVRNPAACGWPGQHLRPSGSGGRLAGTSGDADGGPGPCQPHDPGWRRRLVPRLKRKAAVTRLLGEQLAYVDMDGTSLANGFNPLAAVPGETEEALLQRWQRWFGG